MALGKTWYNGRQREWDSAEAQDDCGVRELSGHLWLAATPLQPPRAIAITEPVAEEQSFALCLPLERCWSTR